MFGCCAYLLVDVGGFWLVVYLGCGLVACDWLFGFCLLSGCFECLGDALLCFCCLIAYW